MAFLGDFGKIFLGGATTGDVGAGIGEFFGVPQAGRRIGEGVADFTGRAGEVLDVSERPAGVDSAATVAPVSQTSRVVSPGVPSSRPGFGAMPAPTQAFIGGLSPLAAPALGAVRSLLTKPSAVGALTGIGGAAVMDVFVDQFGQAKKLVITRKMQRDVKKLFMMSGGDFNMTAQLYRMATGRSITGEQVVKIITKTFKNQGPYVTKAAVRKTRSTIRKMETLCDLKDRLAPPRRAAPRRRATSTTKVLQVK
jgi:hypothetical protein